MMSGIGDATAAVFGALLIAQGDTAAVPASSAAGDGGRGGLQDLLLHHNLSIGPAGADALAHGIRSAGPQLRCVDLSGTSVGGIGTPAAQSVLARAAEAWNERHGSGNAGGARRKLLLKLPVVKK